MKWARCIVSGEHTPCRSIPVLRLPDGTLEMEFEGDTALFQLSVLADARDFDWESMYCNLTAFHNKGQRTGPWDFSLSENNRPLVPSYWVELDGERLGLWFFQRVRLDDLEQKRLRGRTAFQPRRPGRHSLKLTPCFNFNIAWISAQLEPDPEDRLEPVPVGLKPATACSPWIAWRQEAFWSDLSAKLADAAAMYRGPLDNAMNWVMANDNGVADVPLLLAAHRLGHKPGALERIMRAIDASVELPAWGNPSSDGYGHNGDMSAAIQMLGLAQALHMLGDAMGNERRERVLKKLQKQGDMFVRLALLNRDYWGGSLLQDHGWRSTLFFAAAIVNLYGLIPEAEAWLQWALPRIRRSLAAMPRDGVLPPSSYHYLYLYLDPAMQFRDSWLAAGGEDVLDQPQFRPIVSFVRKLLKTPENVMTHFNDVPLIGAPDFFLAMAAKYDDADALWIHNRILAARFSHFYHGSEARGYYDQTIWGLAAYPEKLPSRPPSLPSPRAELTFFRDSGFVHYRNDAERVALSLQVGPWCGYHAYRLARGPCDRMTTNVGPMLFALFLDAKPILVMPEPGYRLKAFMCPCMLVDEEGPYGDIGYPMSIPSWRDRGEEIEDVRWNEAEQRGVVRIDLAPAYERLGVCAYIREFFLAPGRRILCRDTVALDRPRALSWLFHAGHKTGIRIDAQQVAHFGDQSSLTLTAQALETGIRASIHPTDVVWAYASPDGFAGYDHVRYDTTMPVRSVVVEFAFDWQSSPSQT